MSELPQQDPNISICLDDGRDEQVTPSDGAVSTPPPNANSCMPDTLASIVHSPTTDTLDSVALEPSPSDDEGRLAEVTETEGQGMDQRDRDGQELDAAKIEPLDRQDLPEKGNEGDVQEDIFTADKTLEIQNIAENAVSDEYVAESINAKPDTDNEQETSANPTQPTQAPVLSNYFGGSSSGGFFDDLTEGSTRVEDGDETLITSPRVRHLSQPEPEPVSFECEEPGGEPAESIALESEEALLEKETDAFEAFTAEGGDDVPSVDNLSVSPSHQSYLTPTHFPSEHAAELPAHSERQEEEESPDHSAQTPSDTAQKLRLSCTQPLPDAAGLSPVDQPGGTGGPLTRHSGGDANLQPASPAAVSPSHFPSIPGATPPFQTFSDPFSGVVTEDPFTASLHMSDADRQRNAWLPSDHTRQVMVSMVTSAPGTYYPSPDELCMPGLVLDDPQGDPVLEMLQRYSTEEVIAQRQPLSSDSVSQDEGGVRKLIEADCLRAAVDLVGRLITKAGQGVGRIGQITQHSPQTLQLWFLRLTLLTKLRQYSLAESESQAFKNLDTADLYFDYYPQIHPGKRGSMVPFGLRILHAILPHYLGRTQDALDRLYYIHAIVKKILSNLESGFAEDGSLLELSPESVKASLALWLQRETQVLYSIGNCLLSVKDFEAGLEVYEGLLGRDTVNRAELLCALGRIYLQMGDVEKAASYFKQFDDVCDRTNKTIEARISINHGLVALSKNNFTEAYQLFTAARKADPSNPIAVNNLAVCYLYMGRLKESLATLEGMISTDPAANLHEGVLFNLCTLYELESSRANQKKHALLEQVSRYKGDSFPVASLKLS